MSLTRKRKQERRKKVEIMNLIMDILPMEFGFIACNVKLERWIWNLSASESEAEILCIHIEFKSLA